MQPQYTYVSVSSRADDANAGGPPTLNGITKAAWTNDETQTSFVIIFKLSHGITLPKNDLLSHLNWGAQVSIEIS